MVSITKNNAANNNKHDKSTTGMLHPTMPSSSAAGGGSLSLPMGFMIWQILMVGIGYLVVNAAYQFQDKQKAMAFYGVYHRDPANQLIHFFGVPGIIWSALLFCSHLPIHSSIVLQMPGAPAHLPTWATLWFAFYVIFYFSIDVTGALLYFPFLYIGYISAVRMTYQDQIVATKQQQVSSNKNTSPSWTGTGKLMTSAFWVHFVSWYMQIHLGHKVYEGAQPAVMQSLGGALTTAPLFAFYEGVWAAGFLRDFQQDVLTQVDIYTKELCESGVVMKACDSIMSTTS